MGKKAREKKERRIEGEEKPADARESEGNNSVFFKIIKWGTYLVLFTPLILSGDYFFPFVGPKSLYFMALAQVIFFSWLLLIIFYPQYRPKLNFLLIALSFFLLVLISSALFGADLSRSFWSKYERMTGILMWFHLFGFFLAASTVFRRKEDWFKIFSISIFTAVLISAISLFIKTGADFLGPLTQASRGGATLGNTSFLGTYLLFNIFFAFYIIFRLKDNKSTRLWFGLAILIMFWAIFSANARAATGSIVIGLGLLLLLYLALANQKKYLKILGRAGLAVCLAVVLITAFYIFQPGNVIHNWFVEKATYARLVVWEGSWQGFLERPVLGWGPENFELVFTRHFNSCMFLGECGGEIWFDRAHNIVLDTLVANGILGLLAYAGIFLALFYVLWRGYFASRGKETKVSSSPSEAEETSSLLDPSLPSEAREIDFWTAGIFSVLLIAYFIQNLTVFDMVSSYLMFFLVLAFVAHLTGSRPESPGLISFGSRKVVSAIILILFVFSFVKFVVQPVKANRGVIDVLRAQSPEQRVLLAEKVLQTSSLGKYQIREVFADRAVNFFQSEAADNVPLEEMEQEFSFFAGEFRKSIEESPLDYKAHLKIGTLYNFYTLIDAEKVFLAEDALKKAIELSPTNQQGYWQLAQTQAYRGNLEGALFLLEKTIELEPRVFNSHFMVIQLARLMEDDDLVEEKIRRAIEVNPEWEEHF